MSNTIQGIDVSSHQGSVDWERVRTAGKEFVFVRLGWCGYDGRIEANSGLDKRFHTNIQGALAAGLAVGVYVYSYATTPEAAHIAAEETLRLVKPYKLAYPIAFDLEDPQYASIGKTENAQIAKAFLHTIEQAGYYALLYTYKSFAEHSLQMENLSAYDVWIAQYAATCTYAGKYGIWQYAGDKGVCDGVSAACDLNVAYKDYAAMISAAGLNRSGQAPDTALEHATKRIAELEKALGQVKEIVTPF